MVVPGLAAERGRTLPYSPPGQQTAKCNTRTPDLRAVCSSFGLLGLNPQSAAHCIAGASADSTVLATIRYSGSVLP
eukprot:2884183-Rhodomonas_salina.2